MVHGSAGATKFGLQKNLWSPAAVGKSFDLAPTSLAPLEPFRDYLTIVSNTDVRNAEAFELPEIGGDHFRSSAVFLTQAHPKKTQGSDVYVGPSMDQLYAQKFGQETAIPSMQLCIENVDQSGGCAYGYACVYTDTISWASATEPLPMIRDPRVAFDQLFGVGATPAERAAHRQTDRSILDWVASEVARLKKDLGASDRARLSDYLEDVREIERRIQKVEAFNKSGEIRELPEAPIGVPDAFEEHVKLMLDLQVLAFASDVTRVFSFKLGRDGSARVYPESGVRSAFHPASHHGEREERVTDFMKINRYHVSMVPYFLKKLKETPDGESNLLENTLVLYGSPMGNSNVHNHKRVPLFLAGRAGGALKGNLHLKAADGTPMANVLLTLMNDMGLTDLKTFGDSSGRFELKSAPSTTVA
ncbi:MAG: DUF1552 domain-containing protein, partial [Vicinamibacterales bacterium]